MAQRAMSLVEPNVDRGARGWVMGESSSSHKKRPRLVLLCGAVVAILLGASIVGYAVLLLQKSDSFLQFSTSSNWEGGTWSQPLTVSGNPPAVVEFQGKLYMFYSVVTENTIGSDDVVVAPQEHLLYDVLYRVFDGKNFSTPVELSSPTDKISVSGRYFVFKNELHVVLSEWWISNYTSYETETRVHAEVFNGSSWHEEPWPFVEDAYAFHDLRYFVYGDELWAVWQYMERPVAGHFSNVFGFRIFDGDEWTEVQNFTNPNTNPDDWRLTVADGQLWFVWSKSTGVRDPNSDNPHNEVWVGRFDGESWSNVTMVSAADDTGANWGFFLANYRDDLLAIWGGEYFDTSAEGNWVWVVRRLNLSSGEWSELVPISPESGYKPLGTCIYNGGFYVLWASAYQDWKSMIRYLDVDQWSSIYHFDRGYDADGLFVFDNKLWALGADGSYGLNETGTTYLRSYTTSG